MHATSHAKAFTYTPRHVLQTTSEGMYNLDLKWEGGG